MPNQSPLQHQNLKQRINADRKSTNLFKLVENHAHKTMFKLFEYIFCSLLCCVRVKRQRQRMIADLFCLLR